MSAEPPRPPMTRLLAQSARSTSNLVAFGVSIALACAAGNVWIAIMGSWLYTLLIVRDGGNPLFWRKVAELEADAARQLPSEATLNDPSLMLMVQALRKGFDEITRVMKETPEPVKPHLRLAATSLDDVRAHAAQLIRDADSLSRYLLTVPAEATQAAMQKLSHDIARATDESVRAEYERALAVRRDQLMAVADVTREHDRIVASLQLILGSIEAFPAWIYRMRVLEARAKGDRVGDVNHELVDMKAELATSQQLLEGLVPPD